MSGLHTHRGCDSIGPHLDDFLCAAQLTVASLRQVQGHRLADEGEVSLLGTAETLLAAGHVALLTLHVLVDTAVHLVVGILGKKRAFLTLCSTLY